MTPESTRLIEKARRDAMGDYADRYDALKMAAAFARAEGAKPITWRHLDRAAEDILRAYKAERDDPEPAIPILVRRIA